MKYDDFTIILPTLNEEANLSKMLPYLIKEYDKINILVVDDGSRDNTKKLVKSFSKDKVRLLDRHKLGLKRGLTNSIADGIIACRTKYAIVMDADFQHPPEKIGIIAHRLSTGYELVVAYRQVVEDWPLFRKLISKSLINLGYFVLFVQRKQRCKDIFSGFFGIRKELFVKIYSKNKKRFVGTGYKILYDFLKCVQNNTISIYELPITFIGRKEGNSKAGMEQGLALFKSFLS